jgi:hypothetical protein
MNVENVNKTNEGSPAHALFPAESLVWTRLLLSAGGQIRGDYVVGVPVEVLADSVVAHGAKPSGSPGKTLPFERLEPLATCCLAHS